MDYYGNTTWLDVATNTEYYSSELQLIQDDSQIGEEDNFPINSKVMVERNDY